MFTLDDILARTRRQPFQPFRIVTTNDKTYEVRHPDQAAASRRFVIVPSALAADGVPEQFINVALIHIVEIQDVEPVPPAAGGAASNGAA